MPNIVLASSNQHKITELQHALNAFDFIVVAQSEFNISTVAETGLSFIENALIKARHAAKQSGLAAIADDSGLVVPILKGAPGIYSSRYAGSNATDADNNAKLLAELNNIPQQQRQASFYCVLVYLMHADDPAPIIAMGKWDGMILEKPQGVQGFGYDPLFYLPSLNCSAAELSLEQKNEISHRGQALQQLISQLPSQLATHD